jgi:murein DD-endopeptidase MepM/ murein hydrolase activator NlpD
MYSRALLPGLLLCLVLFPLISLLVLSGHSQLQFEPAPKAIGTSTPVTLKIANPHGARQVAVYFEQEGERKKVFENSKPATRWLFFRSKDAPVSFAFNVAGKKEGKGRLVAEVTSNDLMAASDTLSAEVEVTLRPPTMIADNLKHQMIQGGAEVVVFLPVGSYVESGVRAGKYTFRSYPKPGDSAQRFSLFGSPWDVPAHTLPLLYVRNRAGVEVTATFGARVRPVSYRKRDLKVDEAFLEKVVNEINPGGTGGLVERFVDINNRVRAENNKLLAGLRLKTEERLLWTGPFLPLAKSKAESYFADVRSYIYKGKKIDEQVHLGYDLASTQRASVVAANDGKVVWADRLGIYGNAVVVDHGYALQSIYAHLSSIRVQPGETVTRGQEIGRSGNTGLAGGDHLHFSMQLDGVQVNPIEWFDRRWVEAHVVSKINARVRLGESKDPAHCCKGEATREGSRGAPKPQSVDASKPAPSPSNPGR